MLDRILKTALEGVTVIEEQTGGIGKILAKQIAGYARQGGKKVGYLTLNQDSSPQTTMGEGSDWRGGPGLEPLTDKGVMGASHAYGTAQRYVFLEGLSQDLVIIDSISTFLFDKSEKEVVELLKQITRLVRGQKKSFVITYDSGLITDRTAAYLKAIADTVIVVKTELNSDRVVRMLYIPKVKDGKPPEKLIKVTIDESGIQEDTRELVG